MNPFLSNISLASSLLTLGLAVYVLRIGPRRPENVSFAAGMAIFSLMSVSRFLEYHFPSPGTWASLAFVAQIILPVPWLVFSLVFARTDPAGHLKKWRFGIAGMAVLALLLLAIFVWATLIGNESVFDRIRHWSSVFLIVCFALILANFEGTLRAGEHRQKWRIKFLVIGTGSIFLFEVFNLTYLVLFPAAEQDFSLLFPSVVLVGSGLATVSFIRHGLLDVGVAVSRDAVRNSIMLLLIGGSLVLVGGIAAAIRRFGGNFGFYLGALFVFLAAVFLALILLSSHVRQTFRMFLDRNLFRSKYDYRKEWLRLTDRLSSKLEARDLASSLADVFEEIFWINTTRLWLFDDRDEDLRMIDPGRSSAPEPVRWDAAFVRFVMEADRPVPLIDIQAGTGLLASAQGQAGLLREQGLVLLVPLALESHRIGIVGLSESRYGTSFDSEDLALINNIARQAANSFRSAQLAESIVRSKELETFHLFSTFVIHDLKNFVSMLSLVAGNLERNINNPEFQKDASASISRIAEKMTGMMARLSALAGAPVLSRKPTDVNDLVRAVVEEMRDAIRSRVLIGVEELPPVNLDSEQIKNVVRNLVKNADEASDGGGEIRLETAMRDGKACVSVSDEGCGIPEEYMENELFKLFSTTKSDGFGIGLFQSRRIVEQHGGTIDVESEVGKGSTFRIWLPAAGE